MSTTNKRGSRSETKPKASIPFPLRKPADALPSAPTAVTEATSTPEPAWNAEAAPAAPAAKEQAPATPGAEEGGVQNVNIEASPTQEAVKDKDKDKLIEEEQRAWLVKLEGRIRKNRKHSREEIEDLRTIKENRLYTQPTGDHGGFTRFESYMAEVWGRSKAWVTQNLNWLRTVELLEEGLPGSQFSFTVDAAQVLDDLVDYPEQLVAAYLEAYHHQKSLPVGIDCMKLAVRPRQGYLKYLRKDETHAQAVEKLTLEEWNAVAWLENEEMATGLVAAAKALADDKPLRAKVVSVANQKRVIPDSKELVEALRGEDLIWTVNRLKNQKIAWGKLREAEDQKDRHEERVRKAEEAALLVDGEPETTQAEEPTDEVDKSEPKAEYEYELELTGDLMGLVKDANPFAPDKLPLAFADLARNMVGHPITKDSSLNIKVRKK